MSSIAAAANAGSNRGGIFQALVRAFGLPEGTPDVCWADIPIEGHEKPQPHPFILPHLPFREIFKKRPEIWKKEMLGEDAEDFWRHNSETIRLHGSLDKRKLRHTILVGVHGDAGAFSKQESVLTISWNSLLAKEKAATLAKRFVFTTIKHSSLKADGSTMDAIWRIFSWSMNSLLTGAMPEHDWMDRPVFQEKGALADGWCAALVQCRGDWVFLCQGL